MKVAKLVLLPLLFASIIAVFSMTGCTTGGTGLTETASIQQAAQEAMSQQELEDLFADSMANEMSLNTYKFDMDMDVTTEVIGEESGKMTISSKSNGAANLALNQMQMTMEMEMNLEGMGDEGGSQSLVYDIYQMTDWIYMRMEVPGMGEQWVKMPATDELSTQLNLVDQQLETLKSAVHFELLGYASVDGEECYVLSLLPDMDTLADWLNEQQGGGTQDIDWGAITNLSDMFEKLEYNFYITKDSKMPKRLVVEMQMKLNPAQTGEYSESYDVMTMNISVDMTLSDFNTQFSIILPEEAENAMEVSEEMFM